MPSSRAEKHEVAGLRTSTMSTEPVGPNAQVAPLSLLAVVSEAENAEGIDQTRRIRLLDQPFGRANSWAA